MYIYIHDCNVIFQRVTTENFGSQSNFLDLANLLIVNYRCSKKCDGRCRNFGFVQVLAFCAVIREAYSEPSQTSRMNLVAVKCFLNIS